MYFNVSRLYDAISTEFTQCEMWDAVKKSVRENYRIDDMYIKRDTLSELDFELMVRSHSEDAYVLGFQRGIDFFFGLMTGKVNDKETL